MNDYVINGILAEKESSITLRARKYGEDYVLKGYQSGIVDPMEVQLLDQLNNENIIKSIGSFEAENMKFTILPYTKYGDLQQYLESRHDKPLSKESVKEVLRSLLEGVKYLHDNNIFHRDLKLENILVFGESGKDITVKISDLESATKTTDNNKKPYMATIAYSPPEVINGEEPDESGDIWAIGIIAFILITGRFPFITHPRRILLKQIAAGNIFFLPGEADAVEQDFIRKLTAYNKMDRYTAKQALKHEFLLNHV